MKTYLYLFCLLIWVETQAQKSDNFILVKGGKYPFGGYTYPFGYNEDKEVMIELSDFYISPTEVSYKQMAMYALSNGIDPQTFHDQSWGEPDGQRVAINVNWFDAIRYANWLSEQQGYTPVYQFFTKLKTENRKAKWQVLSPSDSLYWRGEWGKYESKNRLGLDSIACNRTAKGYRLPSEAEWEYAASSYVKLGYKQGWAGTDKVISLRKYAYFANFNEFAMATGTLLPNPLGLFDMSGNAWEWCFDTTEDAEFSYKNFENKKNPSNDKYHSLRTSKRRIRGGSWYSPDCNVLNHDSYDPRDRANTIGFRLVRTP